MVISSANFGGLTFLLTKGCLLITLIMVRQIVLLVIVIVIVVVTLSFSLFDATISFTKNKKARLILIIKKVD